MQHTKIATLVTIYKVIQKYRKSWCYASQDTIIGLLFSHHSVGIHRRMLCYHLADLRRFGFLKTWKRFDQDATGHILPKSSANCITIKGARFLTKLGVKGALQLAKSLIKKYGPEPKPTSDEQIRPVTQPGEVPPPQSLKNPFLDPRARPLLGLSPSPPFCPVKP